MQRQGNIRLIWATFVMLAMLAVGAAWNTANALDTTMNPSATVATALAASVDVEPDGGLWINNGGVGPTIFEVNSVDGSIVINTPGAMDNVGAGAAGQLTVTGTPNATFSIGSPVASAFSPGGEFKIKAFYVGNDTIPDNTNILGGGTVGTLPVGGSDVLRVGFQGEWTVDAPTSGVYVATVPITISYQ